MTGLGDEALAAKGSLAAPLAAGVDTIGQNQTVSFKRYIRLVLPLDGYVFWVAANLVSKGALINAFAGNSVTPGQAPKVLSQPLTLDVPGSLHFATDMQQEETETYAVNRMIFTSEKPVNDLNSIGPEELFIAEHAGIKFAFSARGSFYEQADLYHYIGTAVYPDMLPQIVDGLDGFNSRDLIVSNSLPIWLSLNGYAAPYPGGFANPARLFPSFLLPQNIEPAYGAVHIDPTGTKGIAAVPYLDPRNLSHWQLTSDLVRITLYGVRNDAAQTFIDCVNQFSRDTDAIGIMNVPIVRDEKRTQAELGTIAQKKTIEYQVSYYQTAARKIAQQFIVSAIPDFIFPT